METNQKKIKIVYIVLIFLYPLIHCWWGLDLTDSGYNIVNFMQFPKIGSFYVLSSWLSNACGCLFMILPGGGSLLGLKIYCSLIVSIVATASYVYLSRFISCHIVFIGILMTLFMGWCPYLSIYHYLAYLLLDLGIILLYEGLIRDKYYFIILSATCFSLNCIACFSQATDCIMFLLIVAYMFIYKKNIIKKSIVFIGTYICLIVGFLIVFEIIYGWGTSFRIIHDLVTLSNNDASYSVFSLFTKPYMPYIKTAVKLVPFIMVALVGHFAEKRMPAKMLKISIYILEILAVVAGWIVYYFLEWFFFDSSKVESIVMFGFMLVDIAIIISVYVLLNKRFDKAKRLYAFAILLIIFISPMTGNNYVLMLFSNMFLIIPFEIDEIIKAIKPLRGKSAGIVFVAYISVIVACLAFWGIFYTYRDAVFLSKEAREVNKVPRLEGIYTLNDRAEEIEKIYDFAENNGCLGRQLIVYGDSPMLIYILQGESALSTGWVTLTSYSNDTFSGELKELDCTDLPMVIMETNSIFGNCTIEEILARDNISDKAYILAEFLNDNGYEEVYHNNRYMICLCE